MSKADPQITHAQFEAMRVAICKTFDGPNVLGASACNATLHKRCTLAATRALRAMRKAARDAAKALVVLVVLTLASACHAPTAPASSSTANVIDNPCLHLTDSSCVHFYTPPSESLPPRRTP